MTMQHQHFYRRPSSFSDDSSVDDPPARCHVLNKALSSSDDNNDDDEDVDYDEEHGNLQPSFPTRYYQAHRDQHFGGIGSVDDSRDSRRLIVAEDLVEDTSILRPQTANFAGSSSSHAVK